MGKKKVRSYELALDKNAHSDAGAVFRFHCPDCGDSLSVAECSWGANPKCACNKGKREWTLVLYAEARND